MSTYSLPARARFLWITLLAAFVLAVSPASAAKKGSAGTQTAVTIDIYFQVVDEQDLNAFYNTTGSCSGSSSSIDDAYFTGDTATGPTTAYGFGSPWALSESLVSSSYVNGADCNQSTGVCLGANLNHNNKTLSLDTRGTLGPRKLVVNFTDPLLGDPLAGDPTVFGGSANVPALISVFMDNPFTSMAVCSSVACREAQPAFVKLWFDDPHGDPQLTWRVDWPYVRVLRMSPTNWYVLADGCDGTQVAWLYKLHNQKRRQSVSLQGKYLVPFFLSAVK